MEDYYVKNTVILETDADKYCIKIDFKNQQKPLYKYKAEKRHGGHIYAGFFFDLFLNFKDKLEKMTLRFEILDGEKYLILWKDEHRMRIKSFLMSGEEKINQLTDELMYFIDTE